MSYQNYSDHSNAGLWIFLALLLLSVGAWFLFRDEIVTVAMHIFRVVFLVSSVVVDGERPRDYLAVTQHVLEDPRRLPFQGLLKVMSVGGEYLRWVVIPLVAVIAWRLWNHPIQRYREVMSVKRFLHRQSSIWKPVVPVLHLDLIDNPPPGWEPPRHGPELAKAQQLVFNRQLNRDRAREVFVTQLGPLLQPKVAIAAQDAASRRRIERRVLVQQLDRMGPHEKALFAVFALRIHRKPKDAQKLLNSLNESSRGTGVPKFELATPVFERFKSSGKILSIIYPHQYVRTALVQMLCEARRLDGVLPPAEFIWLRPYDPPLFLALNRAPIVPERLHTPGFIDGAGILAQWQAERVAWMSDFRLKGNWVESAVNGLDEDLELSGLVEPKPAQSPFDMASGRLQRPGKGNFRRGG